jgi:Uma2 family endonuclease
VVDMAPMKSAHASAMADLMRLLVESTGRRGFVTCQTPLRVDERSEPEPDLMILLPRADKYAKAHPRPADVLLLVEVSDTTARYDRDVKVPLYAAHGVPEVWIVDLEKRTLRFFRQPSNGQYLDITATETPGVTPVQAMPGLTVDLTDLLG